MASPDTQGPFTPQGVFSQGTNPFIYITTEIATAASKVALRFEYLPESVRFGTSAVFQKTPIQETSAAWLVYANSDINDVSLEVQVVAGLNNAICMSAASVAPERGISGLGGLTRGRSVRATLIRIAQFLYSLPLPQKNAMTGMGKPPPTCRLTIGKYFSGVGAFSSMNITFNGPHDYDGSPTDMMVNMTFMPSEYYDATDFTSSKASYVGQAPQYTPDGEMEVSNGLPYALYLGGTQMAGTGGGDSGSAGGDSGSLPGGNADSGLHGGPSAAAATAAIVPASTRISRAATTAPLTDSAIRIARYGFDNGAPIQRYLVNGISVIRVGNGNQELLRNVAAEVAAARINNPRAF
jgi:hypothetical protein